MHDRQTTLLLRFAFITLVLVYAVILAGAVVRATGSGMGCPDWPKCFGHIVPPRDSTSLPADYKKQYLEKRQRKNERLAKVLRFFGADELAEKILNDPGVNRELSFNAEKAWIEYVNRLLGVALGISQFMLVVLAWRHRKKSVTIFWFSTMALLLTIFEGWLGSLVVSTNLLPGTITVHMFLALGIMALMTGIIVRIRAEEHELESGRLPLLKNILRFAIFLSLLQVWMGTRVREQVDEIATRIDDRESWIGQLGYWFDVHRVIAVAVLLVNAYLFYYMKNSPAGLKRFSNFLVLVIVLEIVAGASLSLFSLPAFIQPVHLMLAVFMFGLQVSLLLRFKRVK